MTKKNQVIYSCKYCGRKMNKGGLVAHESYCKLNPNRITRKSYTIGISSKGRQKKSLFRCEYCGKEWETTLAGYKTHIRFCDKNPSGEKRKGHPHTEDTKKRLSVSAKRNNLGGWHTSRSISYNGVQLDSSYEEEFAKDLDKNNIKWVRPDPFKYVLNGEEHRYYPDFFLPEKNIYVDTKNDYLINHINPRYGISDIEKIQLVSKQNNIKIYILDKSNLLWSCLETIINDDKQLPGCLSGGRD